MISKRKSLYEVCTITMGQSPDGSSYNTIGDGLPFFQGKTEFGLVYPKPVKWCNAPKKVALAEDILLSVRAPVGATNLAKEKCCIGRGLASLRAKPDLIDRDFLLLQLKHLEEYLISKGQGSTFGAIGADFLKNLQIFTPDLSDQKKIATQLTAQLTEIEKAREAVEVQLRELRQFKTKLQEKALDILKDVPRLPLEHFLENIEAGKSMKTTELPAKKDQLGVLKVSAVSWDKFQPDEAKAVDSIYQPKEFHRVKEGDLIISRANTIELVGAVVLVDSDYPQRLLSDKTLRLVLKSELQIEPEYLLQILKLNEARKHIEDNATGTSDSMRNISQKTINKIPVPDSSPEVQKEIIQLFKKSSEHSIQAEEALKEMLKEIKLLPSKLLNEVFQS